MAAGIYKYFSQCRDFGFKDQITRIALSIPSNIAEGFERGSKKYKKRFLVYFISSCAELITQIYIGIDVKYIDKKNGFEWVKKLNELINIKMLKILNKNI